MAIWFNHVTVIPLEMNQIGKCYSICEVKEHSFMVIILFRHSETKFDAEVSFRSSYYLERKSKIS